MNESRRFYVVLLCAVICAGGVAIFDGCSTVTPSIVYTPHASYSGNTRNSGVFALTPAGWVVDGLFRARYNALIETYGAEYALKRDDGIVRITDASAPEQERWLIDRRHFDLMRTMNIKKHSGIAPTQR